MEQFKFFRGTKSGRLNVLDVENRGTASYVDVGHTRFTFAELREPNIERGDVVSEPIRLFNPVRVTNKPNFLSRVKIFFQKVHEFLSLNY